MTYNYPAEDPEYIEAQKRVRKIKKFYKSVARWAGTSIFLVALNIFTTGGISWAKYPIFFWGIALLINVFEVLRLQRHDKEWERRQMEKQLGKSIPESEYTPLEELPNLKEHTFSKELLNPDGSLRKQPDLAEVRKLKKPWKDEDLV